MRFRCNPCRKPDWTPGEKACHGHLQGLTCGVGHEGDCRQIPVVIEGYMQLHCCLALREVSPEKDLEGQISQRTVEGVELVLELEPMALSLAIGTVQDRSKQAAAGAETCDSRESRWK